MGLMLSLSLVFTASSAQLLEQGLDAFARGDVAQARAALKPLADRGSPIAETLIGSSYLSGAGRDPATAAGYFLHAADRGYAPAQLALARLLAKGEGVARDEAAAYRWALLAARRDRSAIGNDARALAADVLSRLSPEARRGAERAARTWQVRAATGN